jgi:endonuclease YncB( thermonuclease family)
MTVPVIASTLLFLCTPVAVWDGDGPIWCAEGPHIRLQGVAARERDGTCRTGHPCPAASGIAARDALVDLLGGPRGVRPTGHVIVSAGTMRCRSTGHARGNRTGAWCELADGRDLNCALIATGTAVRWRVFWRDHRCPAR